MLRQVGWSGLCVLCVAAAFTTGCGGKAGQASSAWVDHLPLPPDTLTVDMDEVGRHGGRFILAQTNTPRTFNSVMGNEQPTFDVTDGRLYASLVEFNNAK